LRLKESDISIPVADWLESGGFTVYSEVPVPYCYSIADLVGKNQSIIRIVELKTSWSDKLFRQCYEKLIITHDVWAASITRPKKSTLNKFMKFNIGMLFVGPNNKIEIIAFPVQEAFNSINYYTNKMLDILQRISPSKDGGKPCTLGNGPAQECEKMINAYKILHPSATWKEIFNNVPNYYSSPQSMCAAIRNVAERRNYRDRIHHCPEKRAYVGKS